MAVGDTSSAFTVPKLLGDERLHLSNVASPWAELLGGLFKHKLQLGHRREVEAEQR